MNIKKGFHSLTKKESNKKLNPEPTEYRSNALLLGYLSTWADSAKTHP